MEAMGLVAVVAAIFTAVDAVFAVHGFTGGSERPGGSSLPRPRTKQRVTAPHCIRPVGVNDGKRVEAYYYSGAVSRGRWEGQHGRPASSVLLAGGPDQDLVDADPLGLDGGVGDSVRDVLCL